MDPQACLTRIIQIVRRTHDEVRTAEDIEQDWSELADAFEELADWLKLGGFPPCATGPIFGTGPVAVGYPGVSRQFQPRFEQRPITHVKSHRSNWRYAICTQDFNHEELWVFIQYEYRSGDEIRRWEFEPVFHCPSCNSKGFEISILGPLRCTFCDGTEGGHPPHESHE